MPDGDLLMSIEERDRLYVIRQVIEAALNSGRPPSGSGSVSVRSNVWSMPGSGRAMSG